MRAGGEPMAGCRRDRGTLWQRGCGPAHPGRFGVVPVAALAALLAACGGDSEPAEPAPSATTAVAAPSSPAPSSVDREQAAVIAAYEEYVRVTNEAANRGDAELPELSEVAAGLALAEAQNTIREHAENGRRYTGARQIVAAEVTKLDVDAPQGEPQAVLEACLDISTYVLTHTDSGDPVDVERGLERFMVTVNLYLIEDEWIVVDAKAHWETPCD